MNEEMVHDYMIFNASGPCCIRGEKAHLATLVPAAVML